MSMVSNNNFDERQILARGKGFQIGFLVSLGMIIADLLAEDFLSGDGSIGINVYSRAMLCIWIPIIVVSVYFILNDAYEKINEKGGRLLMSIFIIMGLFEVVVTIIRVASGSILFIENGVIGDALGQLFVGAALLSISGVYFVKLALNKKAFGDEE